MFCRAFYLTTIKHSFSTGLFFSVSNDLTKLNAAQLVIQN